MDLALKKTEHSNIHSDKELTSLQDEIAKKFHNEFSRKLDEVFEHSLKTCAKPPIKGKITKGKIKWRGIRLIRKHEGFNLNYWLEQRGKQISPKVTMEFELLD